MGKRPSYVVVIIACLLATAAGAQSIYRCERAGKVAFSDEPCEAGAKVTQKSYATAATNGVLDMRVEVIQYPIQGRDYESMQNSLRANGPKGFHGLASWKINYEYTSKRQRDACRIDMVRLVVVGAILMPRWVDEAAAAPDLRRRWSDYYAALKRHEDGHIQHGRELALLVKERLMGLGAVPCEQLQGLAQGEFQRLYTNLKGRDEAYDVRTNHGATQGAVF